MATSGKRDPMLPDSRADWRTAIGLLERQTTRHQRLKFYLCASLPTTSRAELVLLQSYVWRSSA